MPCTQGLYSGSISRLAAIFASIDRISFNRRKSWVRRERKLQAGGPIAAAITVYVSEPPVIEAGALARLEGSVTLVHSPNAARRLDHLAATIDRGSVRIAALRAAVAGALGPGGGRADAGKGVR